MRRGQGFGIGLYIIPHTSPTLLSYIPLSLTPRTLYNTYFDVEEVQLRNDVFTQLNLAHSQNRSLIDPVLGTCVCLCVEIASESPGVTPTTIELLPTMLPPNSTTPPLLHLPLLQFITPPNNNYQTTTQPV